MPHPLPRGKIKYTLDDTYNQGRKNLGVLDPLSFDLGGGCPASTPQYLKYTKKSPFGFTVTENNFWYLGYNM